MLAPKEHVVTSLLYPLSGIARFRSRHITISLCNIICKLSKHQLLEREKQGRQDVLCHADDAELLYSCPRLLTP